MSKQPMQLKFTSQKTNESFIRIFGLVREQYPDYTFTERSWIDRLDIVGEDGAVIPVARCSLNPKDARCLGRIGSIEVHMSLLFAELVIINTEDIPIGELTFNLYLQDT